MTYVQAAGGASTGDIKSIGHDTVETGWLLCDGSAVSRTTYAALFAVIGTTWGVGDGSTTFNLPDMQGRVPVGIGGSGVTSVGDTGGEQTHILTIAEMPSHRHSGSGYQGAHTGSWICSAQATGQTVYTNYEGGDGAHNNMQPYAGVKWVIKT